jgi:hypothetical protein
MAPSFQLGSGSPFIATVVLSFEFTSVVFSALLQEISKNKNRGNIYIFLYIALIFKL